MQPALKKTFFSNSWICRIGLYICELLNPLRLKGLAHNYTNEKNQYRIIWWQFIFP